jgi:hypothetical protein
MQAQHIGARAGNRTLNLGIKRRLTFVARKRQDVSGRASRIRRSDALVSQSVLACHRLPRLSCQISCQTVRVRRNSDNLRATSIRSVPMTEYLAELHLARGARPRFALDSTSASHARS